MMSYREAALEVLRKVQRPMTAKEIITQAVEHNLLQCTGRTPDASLAGRLYTEIKRNGKTSPFVQIGPRTYALREWNISVLPEKRTKTPSIKEALMKLSLDRLWEKFYGSIITLVDELRVRFISELIQGLRASGVNVTNHLLVLGVHSGRLEAASASDIAVLLRYYRINQPSAFDKALSIIERFPEVTNMLADVDSQFTNVVSHRSRRMRSSVAADLSEDKIALKA